MKKLFRKIANSLIMIISVFMLVSLFGNNNTLFAEPEPVEDQTVFDVGIKLEEIEYDDFNSSTLPYPSSPVTLKSAGDVTSELDMVAGTTYTSTFDLNYYGTPLVAVVSARLIQKAPYKEGGANKCTVMIDSDGLFRVSWLESTADVDWKIRIYEADDSELGYNTSKSYLEYFLVGFYDPDESDYIFDTADRTVFYKDADPLPESGIKVSAAKFFKYVDGIKGGFYQSEYTSPQYPDFDAAIFTVSVPKGDNVFEFQTHTIDQGSLQIPRLYSRKYEIDYDYNDKEGPTHTIEDGNPDYYASSPNVVSLTKDPKRTGYDFLYWNNETDNKGGTKPSKIIAAGERGDKLFKAYWDPHKYNVVYDANVPSSAPEGTKAEGSTTPQPDRQFGTQYDLSDNGFTITGYKFLGWTLESGEQTTIDYKTGDKYINLTDVDDVTVTLYAQWEPIVYSVKYDPNNVPFGAPKPTETMTDQTDLIYNKPYNLNKNLYSLDKFDFLGWNTNPGIQEVTYSDGQGFTNLTAEDGGIVTMYAQWQPWKYFLKYDPNGGLGEMGPQTFYSTDSTMKSLSNAFTREGYTFTGFEFEYKNTKYRISGNEPEEFIDRLLELGKGGSITLVAQWIKNPDPIVRYYSIPVTGIN